MIWFTSDTHFNHRNIIKYCNRPFVSVEEMNEKIINNFNSLVGTKDTVFHLGDFCIQHRLDEWMYFLQRLNGRIHLIKGNHDSKKILKKLDDVKELHNKLIWIKDFYYINRLNIALMHYSMRIWPKSHHGSIHLFGHSHGTLQLPEGIKSMDVGVDTNNFYPYSYDEIKEKLI